MVCHCGVNIAGVLDVDELAAYAETLPGRGGLRPPTSLPAPPPDRTNWSSSSMSTASTEWWWPPARRVPTNRSFATPSIASASTPTSSRWSTFATSAPGCMPAVGRRPRKKRLTLIRMGVARALHLEPLEEGSSADDPRRAGDRRRHRRNSGGHRYRGRRVSR